MKKVIILLVGALLMMAGCQLSTRGGIELTISETISAKTFLPDLNLKIDHYQIHGHGPNGETFDVTALPGEEVYVEDLDFGMWEVTVYALNADGVIIGEGKGSVQINTGETSKLTIVVRPLEGLGAIDLEVNWNGAETQNPSITSQIIPASGGDIIKPDFKIIGGNQGIYFNPDMPTGYHTVIVQLYDNKLLTMGAVEVARIIKDQTTFGVFTFEEVNEYGGSMLINIRPEPDDPIKVEILGGDDLIFPNTSHTFTASAPDETENLVFVWYVNGEFKKTGSSADPDFLFEDYPIGVYRLDVTAFTANGRRGGSASRTLNVIDGGIVSGQVGTYKDGRFVPLEGARVGIEPVTVLTDPRGRFRLWDLDFIIIIDIRIEIFFKGFMPTYRSVTFVPGKEVDIGRVALLPVAEAKFPSTEGITIRSPSGSTMLRLPPDIYEYENGKPYEGDVAISYSGLTPDEPGFKEAFVGDFSGVRLDGTVVPFVSYGFGGFELFTPDGMRLQPRADSVMSFAARISPDVEVPEPIPMWFFDTGEGLWMENEARAIRENDFLVAPRIRINIRIRIRIIINIDIPILIMPPI